MAAPLRQPRQPRQATASSLESREYLSAKRRAETEGHCRKARASPFRRQRCNDHKRIWQVLDETLAHYPGMVLLPGGRRGRRAIAACWADSRKVTQIVFKPNWDRDGKAAPFKRNDALLAEVRQAVIVFPGTGITTISPTRPRGSASVSSTTARRLALKRQHPSPFCRLGKRPRLADEADLSLDGAKATETFFSHSFVLRLRGRGCDWLGKLPRKHPAFAGFQPVPLWPLRSAPLGSLIPSKRERALTSGLLGGRVCKPYWWCASKALGLPMRGACLAASKDA